MKRLVLKLIFASPQEDSLPSSKVRPQKKIKIKELNGEHKDGGVYKRLRSATAALPYAKKQSTTTSSKFKQTAADNTQLTPHRTHSYAQM